VKAEGRRSAHTRPPVAPRGAHCERLSPGAP